MRSGYQPIGSGHLLSEKIDDIQNSSNFYLNIDLLFQFERDFKGLYTELPKE
jgi:hypothetical protein